MNCPLLFSPPFTEENFLLPIAMPYLLGIFFKPSRGNVKGTQQNESNVRHN